MAKLKTQRNDASVEAFLDSVEDELKRQDSKVILEMMREVTGDEPAMWGDSIVGFGSYTYKYASGREGQWFQTGFSPRKQNLTLYIMAGFDRYDQLLSMLGKYKTGKSCLYINKLGDIDLDVLREVVEESVKVMAASNLG
jgi:nucleoid DNA-binding protein